MKIFDLAKRMSNITRWSQVHCQREENLLEHTAFVAIYTLYLCNKHDADPGLALNKAIVHDMEEVVIGDIPTPTKYSNENISSAINDLGSKAAKEISDDVFFGKMFDKWDTSKNVVSMDGAIVAISDFASVVFKIWIEVNLGNKDFIEFIPNIERAIERYVDTPEALIKSEAIELLKTLSVIKEIK